jgi:hypothetical protein
LYGLEAIRAANGWAMAVAGTLIVISGLAVLAAVISQLQKIVAFLERSPTPSTETGAARATSASGLDYDPERPLLDISRAVEHYRKATQDLGAQFELKDLFTIFYHSGFPHPHLTIRTLRENGYLVPGEAGYFTWRD